MAKHIKRNGPDNPLVEASAQNRTRLTWYGGASPSAVDGLKVGYFGEGMMFIGPIDTPVRYRRVSDDHATGKHVIEMQLPLTGLRMLGAIQVKPCLQPAASAR